MSKQVGYIKSPGTVDGNLNFYRSEGEYRVRLKPGVDTHRFNTNPVFKGARRKSVSLEEQIHWFPFYTGNVYTNSRCNKLFNDCKKKAIALKNQILKEYK